MLTDLERVTNRLRACNVPDPEQQAAAMLSRPHPGLVHKDFLDHLMRIEAPRLAPPPAEPGGAPAKPVFDLAAAEQKLGQHYVGLGFGNDAMRLAKIRMGQRSARLTPLKVHFATTMAEDAATVKMHMGRQVKQ